MIWSSLARNRSLSPVVARCLGRIATSAAQRITDGLPGESPKTKSQDSATSWRRILRFQIRFQCRNRFPINSLRVLHRRLVGAVSAESLVITVTVHEAMPVWHEHTRSIPFYDIYAKRSATIGSSRAARWAG